MQRRIFGIENEYGVTCTLRGQRRLSPDEVARYLFRRVVSWGRSSNVFLGNGARLYLDVGSHPEYATPECDSVRELVVHDKAGERILEQLLTSAEQRLGDEGVHGDVYLFKNNTDSAGNSYGCHENYCTSRRDDFSSYTEVLIPFLVSRQIYAGAGKVLQTARGAMYCVSQRAEHIWEGVSSATTRSRPIINTRDEPHADAERYRRLHVIVGDSNMSEYTNFLKVGTCSLMLRMLEEPQVVLRDMTLENPIRAIREISHDMTCTRRVRLANGREVSALDIQSEYLNRALRFAEHHELTDEEQLALDMWEYVLTHLEDDPLKLDRELDWVIKYKLIESYRERHDLALSDARVALVDLQYHDVNRERGLFYRMQRRGMVERMVTDAEISDAVEHPPQTTRARLRGEFIKRAKERKRDYTVDWVHLKLNDQAQRTVLCKDPFKAHDERVDKLIASLVTRRCPLMDKLERLLNLTAALLHTEHPLTADELRDRVGGYPDAKASLPTHVRARQGRPAQHGDALPGRNRPRQRPTGRRLPTRPRRVRRRGPALRARRVGCAPPGHQPRAPRRRRDRPHQARRGRRGPTRPSRSATSRSPPRSRPSSVPPPNARRSASATATPIVSGRALAPLVQSRGHWYLSGWDRVRDDERLYRVDRIQSDVTVDRRSPNTPSAHVADTLDLRGWELGDGPATAAVVRVDADQAAYARHMLDDVRDRT